MARKKLPEGETLRRLYVDEGESLEDIAQIYEATRSAVGRALKADGIERRSKSEARLLALQSGKLPTHHPHQFNRHFFTKWSVPMAYVLGLVYSEAYVGEGQISFVFGEQCKGILDNIQQLMESDRELVEFNNHGFRAWRMIFSSREMIEDLKQIGIQPGPNSLRITFPSMLQEYRRHFVRGYYDGDGSASSGLVRFHSASRAFLTGMEECISDELGFDGKLHESPPRLNHYPQGTTGYTHVAYTLLYGARSHRETIYHWFYDEVEEGQFCIQKRERFDKTLSRPPRDNKWERLMARHAG